MKQQSQEWSDFRNARITASQFVNVLARPTSKRYRYYMENIIESLLGFPKLESDAPWFEHGKEWEAEARGLYEWEKDVDVEQAGIIVHPKYDFISMSPDGLVGKNGGIEIKCHKSLRQYIESQRKGLPTQHIPQVQGSLWITGRKWWDFVSYYKDSSETKRLIHVHRVEPDKKYHKRLESACLDFWGKIQERVKKAA